MPTLQGDRTASLLTNTSEGKVIVDTGMEDSFFVEGLTVANSPATKSSKLTSNEIVSTTPSRVPQIASVEDKFIEVAANDLTISPITVIESATRITSFQDGILHIATDQSRDTTIPPFTTGKITVSEPTPTVASISVDVEGLKTNAIENSSRKIGSDKFNPIQADILQNNSSKISFASSISSEQFFSFHNSTPEIINRLNNSATNIWSDLLQSEAQLDINFQITNLPTVLRSLIRSALQFNSIS